MRIAPHTGVTNNPKFGSISLSKPLNYNPNGNQYLEAEVKVRGVNHTMYLGGRHKRVLASMNKRLHKFLDAFLVTNLRSILSSTTNQDSNENNGQYNVLMDLINAPEAYKRKLFLKAKAREKRK